MSSLDLRNLKHRYAGNDIFLSTFWRFLGFGGGKSGGTKVREKSDGERKK